MRNDRPADQLRPIKITRRFTETAAGSVLWQQGKTIVLCTASVEKAVPPWFGTKVAGGWLTADYVMLPGSTPQRKPWPKNGHTDSRGTEIQRLIGRSIRAIIDLSRIGPHTIHCDCQVLQADGGTRTASICGAYLAIQDALASLPKSLEGSPSWRDDSGPDPSETVLKYNPQKALLDELAAVSVGIVDGVPLLDLEYVDDAAANVDLNVAMTAAGKYVEVQGSAEAKPGEGAAGFSPTEFTQMLELARKGCAQLLAIMKRA
jgi:ribonuclease PH